MLLENILQIKKYQESFFFFLPVSNTWDVKAGKAAWTDIKGKEEKSTQLENRVYRYFVHPIARIQKMQIVSFATAWPCLYKPT